MRQQPEENNLMFPDNTYTRHAPGCLLFACALPAAAVTLEPGEWEMRSPARTR